MNNTPERKRRVIHVPLTDKEWKALHDRSFSSGVSKGALTAVALQKLLYRRDKP